MGKCRQFVEWPHLSKYRTGVHERCMSYVGEPLDLHLTRVVSYSKQLLSVDVATEIQNSGGEV